MSRQSTALTVEERKTGSGGAGELPPLDLWDIEVVCRFFGGTRPFDRATIYRMIKKGVIPPPRKIGPGTARWLPHECIEARQRLLDDSGSFARDCATARLARAQGATPTT